MLELLKVAHQGWNVNDMAYIPCDMGKIPLQVFNRTLNVCLLLPI